MKKIIAIIPICILLFACSTGYHATMLNGGYEDFKLTNDTYIVKFRGNGFTSQDQSFKYALRRAAELTKEKGYRYFTITGSSSNINRSFYRTPMTANTTTDSSGSLYGNYGNGNLNAFGNSTSNSTTTITGGDLVAVEKPVSYVSFKISKTQTKGALDSKVILSNFNE